MELGSNWLRRAGVAIVLCGCFQMAGAVEPYQEYNKRIEAAQTLTALKNDLMGDSVSLYNGATEFSVSDMEVPGSGLPVRLTRRFSVDLMPIGPGEPIASTKLGGAGNWDIDVGRVRIFVCEAIRFPSFFHRASVNRSS